MNAWTAVICNEQCEHLNGNTFLQKDEEKSLYTTPQHLEKSEVTALIRDLLAKVTEEMRLEVQEKEVETMRDVALCSRKALSQYQRL